jgi:TfoX/Sxy family transcriptional regulator of competence genes
MDWPKTPEVVASIFAAALPDDPRVQQRKTFGYPTAYVSGHMFAGCMGDDIWVRPGESLMAEVLALPGASRFQPMGRPMTGFVVLPTAIRDDTLALAGWLRRACDAIGTLPPKVKVPRAARRRA